MVLALAGVVGAGAAALVRSSSPGMPGMASPSGSFTAAAAPVIVFFLSGGPVILVLSVAVMVLAMAVRRVTAVVPVLGGGFALYWGMYLQGQRAVMLGAIVLGMLLLLAAFVYSTRGVRAVH